MPEPLEVLWSLAPAEIKLELSLNVIVEVLKMSEGWTLQGGVAGYGKYICQAMVREEEI